MLTESEDNISSRDDTEESLRYREKMKRLSSVREESFEESLGSDRDST